MSLLDPTAFLSAKLKRELNRLAKDNSYNNSVIAKEESRKAEYNKRFENKSDVI